MYVEIMFMLEYLLVEKMHVGKFECSNIYVDLHCSMTYRMLNYLHDEIMYVEKCVC